MIHPIFFFAWLKMAEHQNLYSQVQIVSFVPLCFQHLLNQIQRVHILNGCDIQFQHSDIFHCPNIPSKVSGVKSITGKWILLHLSSKVNQKANSLFFTQLLAQTSISHKTTKSLHQMKSFSPGFYYSCSWGPITAYL